jgi:hypothetical protein
MTTVNYNLPLTASLTQVQQLLTNWANKTLVDFGDTSLIFGTAYDQNGLVSILQ